MADQMQQPIPPGWYEPPAKPGLLAYWDGTDWDMSVPPQVGKRPTDGGLRLAGWLCAFVFPIAGFVIGLVYISRGEKEGWWITGASIVIPVLGFMYLTESFPDWYYEAQS